MENSIEKLEKLIREGKHVRLKVSLVTEDGLNWFVLRQHYVSCPESGKFLDNLFFSGETFTLEKLRKKNEQNENEKTAENTK